VTVNSKEENSEDFCLDFVQELDLRRCSTYNSSKRTLTV